MRSCQAGGYELRGADWLSCSDGMAMGVTGGTGGTGGGLARTGRGTTKGGSGGAGVAICLEVRCVGAISTGAWVGRAEMDGIAA